jgi:type I restriction enzyme M protein
MAKRNNKSVSHKGWFQTSPYVGIARKITSPQSLNAYIKGICDIMRRSGRAGALQYVPEITWMLFLRILDETEEREVEQAKALGVEFTPSLEYPYRWRDWAAPDGKKRQELQMGTLGGFMSFVNGDLLPTLRKLEDKPGAITRQKVVSEVFASIERTGIDTERNLLDILDKINEFSLMQVDETHMFTLSQVYEGLLLKMGEKNNDGGQFFTPREVIRVMVRAIDPKIGETVYDPCCGTGGFLAQAYLHMSERARTADDIETLKTRTFYGREKENLIYPIALANLVLHGIDEPHIWHGNTLTGLETCPTDVFHRAGTLRLGSGQALRLRLRTGKPRPYICKPRIANPGPALGEKSVASIRGEIRGPT